MEVDSDMILFLFSRRFHVFQITQSHCTTSPCTCQRDLHDVHDRTFPQKNLKYSLSQKGSPPPSIQPPPASLFLKLQASAQQYHTPNTYQNLSVAQWLPFKCSILVHHCVQKQRFLVPPPPRLQTAPPHLRMSMSSLRFPYNRTKKDRRTNKTSNRYNNEDVDLEAQTSASQPRFVYNPSSFLHRLLVGVRVKRKLDTSHIVRVPFRVMYKYFLVIMFLLIAAFLTPRLLPKWVGLEWASPQDLCQASERKLDMIGQKLKDMTRLEEATLFLEQQKANLICMEKSAQQFYHGKNEKPPRFLWPDECDSNKAKDSLSKKKCVSQKVNLCSTVGGFAGFLMSVAGKCNKQVGPELCVETNDKDRTDALWELEQKREVARRPNITKVKSEPIVATANSKLQEFIARIIMQVNIASDAFILYTIISIAVGVPLMVCRREKGSRIVRATFGMTKMTFVIVFIVILSVYDSTAVILQETNFARLFQNLANDPCYVDPRFSSRRVALIGDICNNVSLIELKSEHVLQKMDAVYYDIRLFGFCKDDKRKLTVHPKLDVMDKMLGQYRSGELSSPALCNSTFLNEQTSVAPKNEDISKLKVLLGSGVVAQLLLKFIVTSFVLHLVAFVEPMVLHNGKVEVWGGKPDAEFNVQEKEAVTRFARDKHLLPLLIFGVLLLFEIALIIYSLATTLGGSDQILLPNEFAPMPTPAPIFTCPSSLMPV